MRSVLGTSTTLRRMSLPGRVLSVAWRAATPTSGRMSSSLSRTTRLPWWPARATASTKRTMPGRRSRGWKVSKKCPILAILRGAPSSLTPAAPDTHAKVVYHKDGGLTHCFRMANEGDDDIENEEGVWYRSPLVGWMGWPGKEENYPLYYSMIDNWSGGIGPKIGDEKFGETLALAQGSFVSFPSTLLMRSTHTDSVDSSPSLIPTSMSDDGLDLCISATVRGF